ncbi:hypothetical protein AVENP_1019 [Arcobacter venerupis]|jgi:hypothetical protein|uniref:Uncharacterized protein n=1 Tax=Arcobacter venerupis TaxID=1054033 RepID=A0AAE7BA52_9BACT|nr:hypothetical protein [Arcobacter venerupis]QKF66574.1 hypothetical protein AVENP_1019 [Arcobacter venerupis]RWS49688.1 hypothetical protein CKA56_08185 [Arcobacter venerupis]
MNEYEVLSKLLFEKFGKITMDEDETAQVVGCSDKSLQNDRAEAIGIPYTRRNGKERGQVIYLITTVAKHLIDNKIKTI